MSRQSESIIVARAALNLALSGDRTTEKKLKEKYLLEGIKTTAVDYGGEFLTSVQKVVERAVVAAKRENIIEQTHLAEGGVAGATREALSQIMPKAIGLNVGGKVGIARKSDHVVVAIFFAIGLLHLNEVGVGLGHRVISINEE
ncbi:MAG: HutP family protein [Dethiobacteria bacterium]